VFQGFRTVAREKKLLAKVSWGEICEISTHGSLDEMEDLLPGKTDPETSGSHQFDQSSKLCLTFPPEKYGLKNRF